MLSKDVSKKQRFHFPGWSNRLFWAVLGGLLSLVAILLLLAPIEKTLGEGIRSVYLHVALTWAGMLGIVVSALLGLGTIISGRKGFFEWARTIGWVALVLFAAGLLMSILAANINWGAVFWQEPRTLSALEILAFGLVALLASYWPIPVRLKALLYVLVAGYMIWNVNSTPLVLHPGNAARNSPSLAIRWSFLGLFALVSGAATWIVINRRIAANRRVPQEHKPSKKQ